MLHWSLIFLVIAIIAAILGSEASPVRPRESRRYCLSCSWWFGSSRSWSADEHCDRMTGRIIPAGSLS